MHTPIRYIKGKSASDQPITLMIKEQENLYLLKSYYQKPKHYFIPVKNQNKILLIIKKANGFSLK